MAIQTRIYRDTSYSNGSYHSAIEFTLPELTQGKESVNFPDMCMVRNKKVEQASSGYINQCSLAYYDNGKWIELYSNKDLHISYLSSNNTCEISIYPSDMTMQDGRELLKTCYGKKIRFQSNYETTFYDMEESSAFYILERTTYKTPIYINTTITREHDNNRYKITPSAQYCGYWNGTVTSGSKQSQINNANPYISYSSLENGQVNIALALGNADVATNVNITFNHFVATVSNLKCENDNGLIDDITTLSWVSNNQGKVEIYNNNILIKTINGSIQSAILSKGTLKVGKNKLQIRVFNIADNTVINSQTYVVVEQTLTLQRILPTITKDSFKISDTNIDNNITLSWEATNQNRFAIYQGEKLIITGKQEQTVTLQEGALNPGISNIKLVVYYDSGFDSVSVESIVEVTLKRNDPIIYNLEPSNLNIDIDQQINVTFSTNEFCTKWELTAGGLFTQGTTDRKVSFGKNVFTNGVNTIKLIIYYTVPYNNTIRKAEKTVTFTGYGAPSLPVIDTNTTYATATPTITWNAINQTAYSIIVTKDGTEVVNTGDVISNISNYTFTEALEDNTTYTIKVRYKNSYKWSLYATKEFNTLFSDVIIPNFALFEDSSSVHITVDGYQDQNFKSLSILRKAEFEKSFLEIADNCNVEDTIIDFTCPANTNIYYKLRVYDVNNGYKDSEIKSIKVNLLNYNLTNIENANDTFRLDFASVDFTINNNIVTKVYAGNRAPRVYKGTTNYKSASITATLSNEDTIIFNNYINNANDYNLFCYRDWKGEKLFVTAILDSINPINAFYKQITFNIIEVNFVETKMYTGSGFRKIVYLNGEYSLNGDINLSGYDDNYGR